MKLCFQQRVTNLRLKQNKCHPRNCKYHGVLILQHLKNESFYRHIRPSSIFTFMESQTNIMLIKSLTTYPYLYKYNKGCVYSYSYIMYTNYLYSCIMVREGGLTLIEEFKWTRYDTAYTALRWSKIKLLDARHNSPLPYMYNWLTI